MAPELTPKQALRRAMRRMRGALAPDDLATAARQVIPRVLELPGLHDGPVFLYVSIRRELPTEPLFEALWAAGVPTAAPVMVSKDRMEAHLRGPGEPLFPDACGIPAPKGPVVVPTLVLCPGLAFDRRGGRLGYGGGNYDRWLAEQPRRPRLVGLCVDDAVVAEVPTDAHDVPMDAVVTPMERFDTR